MIQYSVEVMTFGNDRTDEDGWDNTGWMLVSRDPEDPTGDRNQVLAITLWTGQEPPAALVQECERLTDEARRRVTIAESAEQAKKEVVEWLLSGPVTTSRGTETITPEQITSFGDLHDYCDANVMGWLCDEDVVFVDEQGEIPAKRQTDAENDRWIEFGNKMQDEVDAWIKAGGHRG